MKRVFKLYVDELGMSHPASFEKSPYYILVGCIIDERFQRDLENYANHIKYKYWGRTDIIFHSVDMAHNTKDFHIFAQNPEKKREFYSDLLTMLHAAPVTITASIIDKEKAYKSYWTEQTVISRSAEKVLFNFLAYIYTRMPCKGKVIIEASNCSRDMHYLKAFNNLLGPNLKRQHIEFDNVRNHLTSINFVTKQNHDIESQVADLLAYGIRCIHGYAINKSLPNKGTYEARIIKVTKTKLIKITSNMGIDKKKYFTLVEPISVVPKKVAAIKKTTKKKRG